ncbi:uncharacterized protein LOC107818907 isoform X4 [Nicotiana tabacum]|uniref:Uncharacterized protein LOC107818907 isoform X4 n=1 Tax=Nicotiana tabacum TaxID=4097 RepID=A0A1S4CH68_TOBAC|nr:PREDICTED: uncharacterized protein LOC107818907 isoform X4 [Nicotiana tabacum]
MVIAAATQPHQLKVFAVAFQLYDLRKTGYIEREEVHSWFPNLSIWLSERSSMGEFTIGSDKFSIQSTYSYGSYSLMIHN